MKSSVDSASVGGGLQDVYMAAAQFEAIGGGSSKTATVVLAGAVGLLFLGLAVLIAAMTSRRRAGPAANAPGAGKAAARVG